MTMHANETPTDASLVRRLLATQFPAWADLPIEQVPSSGTVNALYRLGEDLVARLPRTDWALGAVDKELRWLPEVGRALPAAAPIPLAKGRPGEDYTWEWGVYPWLEGEHPTAGSDPLVGDLARFIAALHGVEVSPGSPHGRGAMPLTRWDEPSRAALAELRGTIDVDAAAAAWDAALATAEWRNDPVWTHGDLMPANLLVRDGALSAVLDWEGMGLGDPAADLAVAWNLLDAEGRKALRTGLDVDDATWSRGRGWALATGLVALPYYRQTNPKLAENARYRVDEVLADFLSP